MTASLVDRIISRDLRAIARAISKIENDAPDANDILKALFAHTGKGVTIGITGAGRGQIFAGGQAGAALQVASENGRHHRG